MSRVRRASGFFFFLFVLFLFTFLRSSKLCRFVALPVEDPLWTDALFVPLAVGLIGVIGSLRFFGMNKSNFLREQQSG
jgi:hypothetical protein